MGTGSTLKTLLALREAARIVGLSTKTLLRAHQAHNLKLFKAKRSGRWHVRQKDLREAFVISLGKAGTHLGYHPGTLRRWIRSGKIQVRRSSSLRLHNKGWHKTSLLELARIQHRLRHK